MTGYFVTVSYIKKRNYFCLVHKTGLSFASVGAVLKKSDPLSYAVLRRMRDKTFFMWRDFGKKVEIELVRRTASLPSFHQQKAMAYFAHRRDVEILQTIDTMRFPNDEIFYQRLFTLMNTAIRKALALMHEQHTPAFDEDDDVTEEQWLSVNAENLPETPLELLVQKEESPPDLERIVEEFLRTGLVEEAEYIRKFRRVNQQGGRISKYERRKLAGSIKFFLLSLMHGGEDDKTGA